MTALRVIVADDEPVALQLLADLLDAEPGFEVVATCADGRAALEAIRTMSPDVAFLDIRMPELDGFAVVDALESSGRPAVVFVTAYDQYALEAFERHALAYLLKPFDDQRFRETVEHVRALVARRGADLPESDRIRTLLRELAEARHTPPLLVRSGARTRLIPVATVDWIEADGNYARLHCADEVHLSSQSLGELATALTSAGFVRIHRSTVVNLSRVVEFESHDRRDFSVVLTSGTRLKLSRTYREEVERRLRARL